MIDLPYLPKPERRLRWGFGCLAGIMIVPMTFGCVSILANKLGPFGLVAVGLMVGVTGVLIWLARQRA